MPPFGREMFSPSPKTEEEIREEERLSELEVSTYTLAEELLTKDPNPLHKIGWNSVPAYYQTDEQKGTMYCHGAILRRHLGAPGGIGLYVYDKVKTPEGTFERASNLLERYRDGIEDLRATLLPARIIAPEDRETSFGNRRYEVEFNNRQRIEFMEGVMDTIDLIRQATIAQQSVDQAIVS